MNMNHVLATKQNKSVLTLVQACVAIAVLALVVVIIIGISSPRGSIEAQRRTQDISNLRQISTAYLAYAQDHEDIFPIHPRDAAEYTGLGPNSMGDLYLNPYQEGDEAVDRGDGDGIAVRYGGYVFVNLGLNLDEIEKPAELVLAYTAKVSEKQTTRNVAFADGHVESWEEEKLRAVLPKGVDVDALDGP